MVLDRDQATPNGELRRLVILSSDLRDFTRMSNTLTPQQVVQTLNIYFGDMIEVLNSHSIHVDKFMGDGILAFVDPNSGDEATCAELGARAALEMQERLNLTNDKLRVLGLPNLRLGVALHAGEVVLGSIGAKSKLQYTIIGDSVNLASRLESFCKILGVGIVISAAFRDLLTMETQNLFRELGWHEVRGISGPVRLYGTGAKPADVPVPADRAA